VLNREKTNYAKECERITTLRMAGCCVPLGISTTAPARQPQTPSPIQAYLDCLDM